MFSLFRRPAPVHSGAPTGNLLHFSLVKFNPFPDTGGEQSFALALLDGNANGVVLTSLHGRGFTRLYAKKIVAGTADQDCSTEEKQAIAEALKS